MINSIIEEHQTKTMLKPHHGIDASLFEELNQQTSFCQKAAQCSINREKTINEIKKYHSIMSWNLFSRCVFFSYITNSVTSPLVIYGPEGCGKSTLMSRIAQSVIQWQPEAFLIMRFIGISAQSSTIEQLLSSITNQCSILIYGNKCYCAHVRNGTKQNVYHLFTPYYHFVIVCWCRKDYVSTFPFFSIFLSDALHFLL